MNVIYIILGVILVLVFVITLLFFLASKKKVKPAKEDPIKQLMSEVREREKKRVAPKKPRKKSTRKKTTTTTTTTTTTLPPPEVEESVVEETKIERSEAIQSEEVELDQSEIELIDSEIDETLDTTGTYKFSTRSITFTVFGMYYRKLALKTIKEGDEVSLKVEGGKISVIRTSDNFHFGYIGNTNSERLIKYIEYNYKYKAKVIARYPQNCDIRVILLWKK
jgi:hypothetical protein